MGWGQHGGVEKDRGMGANGRLLYSPKNARRIYIKNFTLRNDIHSGGQIKVI